MDGSRELQPGDRVGLLRMGQDTGRRGTVRWVYPEGDVLVDIAPTKGYPIQGPISHFFRIGEDGPDDGGES